MSMLPRVCVHGHPLGLCASCRLNPLVGAVIPIDGVTKIETPGAPVVLVRASDLPGIQERFNGFETDLAAARQRVADLERTIDEAKNEAMKHQLNSGFTSDVTLVSMVAAIRSDYAMRCQQLGACSVRADDLKHERDQARGDVERLRRSVLELEDLVIQSDRKCAEALAARDQARQDAMAIIDERPGPTAWAYEQACAALEKHRQRADLAELDRDALKAAASRYLRHMDAQEGREDPDHPDPDALACDERPGLGCAAERELREVLGQPRPSLPDDDPDAMPEGLKR